MSSGCYKKRKDRNNVCQYSIGIRESSDLDLAAVVKAIQMAGFEVVSAELEDRYEADDYDFMYGEEDE